MNLIPSIPERAVASMSRKVDPNELLSITCDGAIFELVAGHLLERPSNDVAQAVTSNLAHQLSLWTACAGSLQVLVRPSLQCLPEDPATVRRPDVAVFAKAALSSHRWGQHHFTVAPELVADVIAPGDRVIDVERRIRDYFSAGVRRAWILNPDSSVARVYRARDQLAQLVGAADLRDEEILPGFRCSLRKVFALP